MAAPCFDAGCCGSLPMSISPHHPAVLGFQTKWFVLAHFEAQWAVVGAVADLKDSVYASTSNPEPSNVPLVQ